MTKKNEINKKDLSKVTGGINIQKNYVFKCKDCGQEWETNNLSQGKKCISCCSTNIKRIV